MTTYVLNSPILTAEGTYTFRRISADEAKNLVAGGFVSAIGHDASAAALSAVLGVTVPTNRVAITMQTGDAAVVLKLAGRLPEGKVLNLAELEALGFDLYLIKKTA